MKRRVSALLTAVLALTVSLPVYTARAEEPGPMPPKAATGILFDGEAELLFLLAGEDPGTLPLEMVAYATAGWRIVAECEIVWRLDGFDSQTPGRRILTGDVHLPEDCLFEGELPTVEYAVIVYDGSGAPFVRLINCFYTATFAPVVVPLGAAPDETAAAFEEAVGFMFGMAECHTEYGDNFLAPVTFDLSAIDTQTPGVYYPVTVALPGGIYFAGQEPLMISAYVVPADEVLLGALGMGYTDYYVQWVYRAAEPVLWASVDGGNWEPTQAFGRFFYEHDDLNGLYIPYASLTPGHVYQFQVEYDDGRFSDILELDFSSGDVPVASNLLGGDRGGMDRGESPLPAMLLPPPEPPEEPLPPAPADEPENEGPSGYDDVPAPPVSAPAYAPPPVQPGPSARPDPPVRTEPLVITEPPAKPPVHTAPPVPAEPTAQAELYTATDTSAQPEPEQPVELPAHTGMWAEPLTQAEPVTPAEPSAPEPAAPPTPAAPAVPSGPPVMADIAARPEPAAPSEPPVKAEPYPPSEPSEPAVVPPAAGPEEPYRDGFGPIMAAGGIGLAGAAVYLLLAAKRR